MLDSSVRYGFAMSLSDERLADGSPGVRKGSSW